MDYYDRKIKANLLIDELLAKETPIPKIVFKLSTTFGFGENFVNRRSNEIKAMNKLQKEYDTIKKKD